MEKEKKTILKMVGITKDFSGVRALDEIHFDLRKGEIHSLMGENGAGKSTMIKMLAGIYHPTKGEIYIEDRAVKITDVPASKELGIAVIHQELSLVPEMTVAENIYLGRMPATALGFVDDRKLNEDAAKVIRQLGLEEMIDVNAKPVDLTIAQQQMVEIARALSVDAKILIMDEPTASLTNREIEHLLEFIIKLKNTGVAIIYISHRMDEVFRISDRITVFRDGQYIDTKEIADITYDDTVRMMIGRDLSDGYPQTAGQPGAEILRVEQMNDNNRFKGISFRLRKGEILGFYGLVGSGRTELMRGIFGIDPYDEGRIFLEERQVLIKRPQDAIDLGIALAPENRKEQGLILIRDIKYNMVISILKEIIRGIRTDHKKEDALVEKYMKRLRVKATSSAYITGELSGGNQQKVVLAKWLATEPKVLILDEPTRGVDVGAKFEIYKLITELADMGMGIIFISSELTEVINLSTRLIIMHEGRKMGELEQSELTEETVMKYATGGLRNEK